MLVSGSEREGLDRVSKMVDLPINLRVLRGNTVTVRCQRNAAEHMRDRVAMRL